jgi:hypothetical protein
MAYEKDIKDLIEQMSRQQQSYQMPNQQAPQQPPMAGPAVSQQGIDTDMMGGTDQSPHLFNQGGGGNSPDQSPLNPVNSVRPMGTPINKEPPKPASVSTAEGACPQCGTIHPPVRGKCPMAGVKVKDEKGQEKEVDVNKYLAQLKNIIVSQVEQKNIKDVDKLFKNIIVEVTKYIEGYSE